MDEDKDERGLKAAIGVLLRRKLRHPLFPNAAVSGSSPRAAGLLIRPEGPKTTWARDKTELAKFRMASDAHS